jgi:hypothetical protein
MRLLMGAEWREVHQICDYGHAIVSTAPANLPSSAYICTDLTMARPMH